MKMVIALISLILATAQVNALAELKSQSKSKPLEFAVEDDISLEIQQLVRESLEPFENLDSELDRFVVHIESQVSNVRAFVTDEKLTVGSRSEDQVSLAMNFPDLSLVLFNRKKWRSLSSRDLRRAVALHEVLSLMGIERTGVYIISNNFLAARGLSSGEFRSALEGHGDSRQSETESMSCEWIADRILLTYEIWSQGIERCRDNGGKFPVSIRQIEVRLRETLQLAQLKCRQDKKVFSLSTKVHTLLSTLKASAIPNCQF